MPARSSVGGDGVCIVGQHAKPTRRRARLPKRVRPTSRLLRPTRGCKARPAVKSKFAQVLSVAVSMGGVVN
eukprot:scaffold14460_cov42-Phaeocystis_antarctica.AAC.1